MMITKLLLFVLTATFLLIMSNDILSWIKNKPIVARLVFVIPLFTLTLCIITFEPWVVWALEYIKASLLSMSQWLAQAYPHPLTVPYIQAILATFCASIPILLKSCSRKHYKDFKPAMWIGTWIWLGMIILLCNIP